MAYAVAVHPVTLDLLCDTPPEGMMAYQETFIQRDQHRIYVRDHPGAEPAIILMHGFPDNVHLYDRLSPYLSPPRRVVLFDFLGWGSSDKPFGYPYTADNQVGDLDAVITQLGLGQVVLVAHDASGPPAIDWALANSERQQETNMSLDNTPHPSVKHCADKVSARYIHGRPESELVPSRYALKVGAIDVRAAR